MARRARDLTEQTGRDVTLRADARIQKTGGKAFSLSLTIDHAGLRAERTLSSPDCAALGEATAWLIALAIDPSLRANETQTLGEPSNKPEDLPKKPNEVPAPAPTAETPAKRSEAPSPKTDATTPETQPRPLERHVRFGLSGGVLSQGLAGPSGILGAYVGLGWGFAYSELRLAHAFARTEKLANDAEVELASQTIAFSQCYEADTFVHLTPCLFALGERTVGDAQGIEQEFENTSYWLIGGVGLGAFYELVAPFEVSGRLDLGMPLTSRPRFLIDTTEVAQARLFSFSVSLGVGARY